MPQDAEKEKLMLKGAENSKEQHGKKTVLWCFSTLRRFIFS